MPNDESGCQPALAPIIAGCCNNRSIASASAGLISAGLSGVLGCLFMATAATVTMAADRCFPNCDYTHYYGPFDFTYERPDMVGHLHHCGPQGECAPDLAYTAGNRRRIGSENLRHTAPYNTVP